MRGNESTKSEAQFDVRRAHAPIGSLSHRRALSSFFVPTPSSSFRSSHVLLRTFVPRPLAQTFSTETSPAHHMPSIPARYSETTRLAHSKSGHTDGVACLAFSSAGSLLASGGLDGKLCVWSTRDGKLQLAVQVYKSVLSLTWAHRKEDFLVCGLEDGTLVSVRLSQASQYLHTLPSRILISLAVCAGCCAYQGVFAGAQFPHRAARPRPAFAARVRSTRGGASLEYTGQRYVSFSTFEPGLTSHDPMNAGVIVNNCELEAPPQTSINRSLELLVTGVHWTRVDSTPALLVSYMHHGIMCALFTVLRTVSHENFSVVDSTNWTRIRTVPPYAGHM